MPITLRHITADSTWLITLTSPHNPPSHPPYNILVDPWIEGPSRVWHSKFAQNHHTIPSSISNLSELNPQPDLLLISQTKTDHCNEATCRQLAKDGIKVYTVPGADSIVRSWKHFDVSNVHRLRPFTSRKNGRVSRIPIYRDPATASKKTDEADGVDNKYTFETDPNVAAVVELAFLPALKPWEIPSIHIGLGITYTPTKDPDSSGNSSNATLPPSPPQTPPSTTLLHPNAPMKHPLQSTSSVSTISSNHSSGLTSISTSNNTATTTPTSNRFPTSLMPPKPNRTSPRSANLKLPGRKSSLTESILYAPHGVPASALTAYLTCLPLPLTVFLHCFVQVNNPKWLGGTVSSGLPNAFRIIQDMKKIRAEQARLSEEPISPKSDCSLEYGLGVKYLVATHDEEVEMEGFCSYFVKKRKWSMEEVVEELKGIVQEESGLAAELESRKSKESEDGSEVGGEDRESGDEQKMWSGPEGVKLLDLAVGEQAVLV
ncbi:hypothetical protein ABW20_dc0104845 [Dactylellina cionopaga]|nr:hypothetical protein ABW20_dc0104845 [Dactylellina cionopaga]